MWVRSAILILFLMVFASSVSANSFGNTTFSNRFTHGWNLDSIKSPTWGIDSGTVGGMNLIGNGIPTQANGTAAGCAYGNCSRFSSFNFLVNTSLSIWDAQAPQNFSLSCWVKQESVSDGDYMFEFNKDFNRIEGFYNAADTSFYIQVRASVADICAFSGGNDGLLHHYVIVYNASGSNSMQCWKDAVNTANVSLHTYTAATGGGSALGGRPDGTSLGEGIVDDCVVAKNYSLSTCEIKNLYDGSCTGIFNITARDANTHNTILSFNATVNGINYATTTGSLLLSNQATSVDVTVYAAGYLPSSYSGWNTGTTLIADMSTFAVSYSNYVLSGGTKYVRSLDYNIFSACSSDIEFTRVVTGSSNLTFTVPCVGGSANASSSIQLVSEGFFNISFATSVGSSSPERFFSDLNNPTTTLSQNLSSKVSAGPVGSDLFLRCQDSAFPNLNYTIYTTNFQNLTTLSNGSTWNQTATLTQGQVVTGVCGDPFGNTSQTISNTIVSKRYFLVDELTGVRFDLSQVRNATVWINNQSLALSLKTTNITNFSVSGLTTTWFTVVLDYADIGQTYPVITRYISLDLLGTENNICANPINRTHYLQFLTAGVAQAAVVRNTFTQCVILADTTRFTSQDFLLSSAYTIESNYYLSTVQSGRDVFLGSLIGSLETSTNLDNLIFVAQGYNINQGGQVLVSESYSNATIRFDFRNTGVSYIAGTFEVRDQGTDGLLFSTSSFTDPNEFTVYFDFSSQGLSNTTLLIARFTGTTAANEDQVTEITVSLNAAQQSDAYGPLYVVLAFFILFLSIGIASIKLQFGWFGVAMGFAALVIASLGGSEWYVRFTQFVCLVVIVYCGICGWSDN